MQELKPEIVAALQDRMQNGKVLPQDRSVGYVCIALPKAVCLLPDIESPVQLAHGDLIKRTAHWLHVSVLYLDNANEGEMAKLTMSMKGVVWEAIQAMKLRREDDLWKMMFRPRKVFVHATENGRFDGDTHIASFSDYDIEYLWSQGALPSLNRELQEGQTNVQRYKVIARRDRARSSAAEHMFDEWRFAEHKLWCAFDTNSHGLGAFDIRLRVVLQCTHEFLRYKACNMLFGMDPDRIKRSHMPVPEAYHCSDWAYHYLCYMGSV